MAKKKNNRNAGSKNLKIQQAPQPAMASGNEARYINNLNAPGTDNYNAQYGGGGWVNYKAGTPQSELASDDFLRAYSKATTMANRKQGMERMIGLGSESGVMGLAAQFDAEQATQGQSPSATASPQKSYKDIKSISGGLKIGGDNILGRREARRIARGTGRSYDDVIEKALGRGMSIGGGAVRQSNRAYEKSGQALMDRVMGGLTGESPLSEMRRVNPGKRQMFSGTYQLDGKTMPLIESRRGGTNPMSIGGGAGGRGKRGGKGRKRGGGGMTDVGTGTGTGMGTQPTMDLQPMTPEQMQEASTVEGVGMLSGGGMGATGASRLGRARSRLRQLGIYGRGTSLFGRGLQYGNTLNA